MQLERGEPHESADTGTVMQTDSLAHEGWQDNKLLTAGGQGPLELGRKTEGQGFIDFSDVFEELAAARSFQKDKTNEASKNAKQVPPETVPEKAKNEPEPAEAIMGGAGGAPPDENNSRYGDPDYDPEYGTVQEFVRQHRIDPKAPSKELEPKDSAEKELDKREKEASELREVLKRLEQTLLSMDLVKDGKISPEKGKEVVEKIREALRPFTKDINGKNIAFSVVEVNGERKVVIGISGGNTPGAKVPDKPIFQIKAHGNMPRTTDSEFKILDQVVVELKNSPKDSRGNIAVFTEQKPCDSCDSVISRQVPSALKYMGLLSINPPGKDTWLYANEKERLAANRRKAK